MNIAKIFLFSVFSVFVFAGCQSSIEAQSKINLKPENINKQSEDKQTKPETPEQKAIRLAEEFIRRNGYTDAAADKDNLSYESIEFSSDKEEMLELRKNSLEAKAFGVSPVGRGNQKGWTVAFRYNKTYLKDLSDDYDTLGRAVTMNENFENLRVEHKSISLDKLEKKLQ